jgi:hypothetical protein
MVGCLCLSLCSATPCLAKEWRGIVPLRSTRSDVLKLLGDPKHTLETDGEYFDLDGEKVTLEWIDPTCEREYPVKTKSRPGDLVLHIYVFPKSPLPLKELGAPETGYMTLGCHPGGSCTLWSPDAGLGFTTAKGGVTRHFYGPTVNEFTSWSVANKGCKQSARPAT